METAIVAGVSVFAGILTFVWVRHKNREDTTYQGRSGGGRDERDTTE